ncbi:class C beta-lactamase-related serine hydrolase [candidate division KSB1 bacterium]|nr:serine hydrolase [candidate division KSB1 bacterium]RQW00625.1 MAG: class C beta-lactamase-related serine hydrolase [candidate division KSB1 bacterium]
MMNKYKWLGIFLLCAVCCRENATDPSVFPGADEHHIDSGQLEQAFHLARQDSGISALIVARHNVVVAEEIFHTGIIDTTQNIYSITKSVLSILTGIALEKGLLENIDQKIGPIIENLSEACRPEHENLTIRHLLTMSCGLPWSELDALATDYTKWASADNQVDYVLSLPFVHPPGEIYTYNSGASHLLSVILAHASKETTQDFANKYLFTPLQISPGAWSKDKQGYYNGSSTLRLGPHALLKIGLLVLNNGRYKDKQVVPQEWITLATQQHITTNNAVPYGPGYGFLWWAGRQNGHDYYFANGWGGQFILNVPTLELTIVAQSNWNLGQRQAHEQWWNTINLIMSQILPAVRED